MKTPTLRCERQFINSCDQVTSNSQKLTYVVLACAMKPSAL